MHMTWQPLFNPQNPQRWKDRTNSTNLTYNTAVTYTHMHTHTYTHTKLHFYNTLLFCLLTSPWISPFTFVYQLFKHLDSEDNTFHSHTQIFHPTNHHGVVCLTTLHTSTLGFGAHKNKSHNAFEREKTSQQATCAA